MRLTQWLMLCLLGSAWLNSAQALVPRFKPVPEVGLLPSSTVRVITEDQHGFIWAGTNQGLFRYDGYTIRPKLGPPDKPTIAHQTRINDLYFAPDNRVWVATNTEGLLVYDQNQQQTIELSQFNHIKKINLILPAADQKSVWVGTDQGLFSLDIKGLEPKNQSAILSDHNVISLLEQSGQLIIGTTQGLFVLDISTRLVQPKGNNLLANTTITAIQKDQHNSLWVSTKQGLYVKHDDTAEYALIAATDGLWLSDLVLSQDQLWISTIGSGVLVYDVLTAKLTQHLADQHHSSSLSGDNVLALYLDRKKTLWLGHFNAGLDLLPLNHLNYGLNTAGPGGYACAPTSDVYSLYVKDQVTLIGGTGHVSSYDDLTGNCQVAFLNDDTSNRSVVYDIYPTDSGEFLLATGLGIFKYHPSENEISDLKLFDHPKPFFMVTFDDSLNAFVLGGDDGLWFLTPDFKQVNWIPFETNEPFFDTATNGDDRLFVGNLHLVRLNSGGYLKPLFKEPGGLNSATIDQAGVVWVGSKKRGLLRWQKSGELTPIFEHHPRLHDANIMSVLSLPDQLWVSSNKGLIQYQPSTGLIIHHDSEQALQALQFNPNAAFADDTGHLYFGGRGGYNRLKVNQFSHQRPEPPKVMLTELTQFNQTVWPGQKDSAVTIDRPVEMLNALSLNHRNEFIGFEWTSDDLAHANSVLYKSRLLGMHDAWSEAQKSVKNIAFTRLPAGDYTFQVMSSYDGIHWPEKPLSLDISVSPPPWLSPWALISYFVLLLALVFIIIHLRTRAAYQKNQVLKDKVEERTLELIEKNAVIEDLLRQKNALFANITHEFKTPLTLILGPINKMKKLMQSKSHHESPRISDLHLIERNANRLLNMVGHLLKLSAAEDLENQQKVTVQASVIAAMILDSFHPMAELKDIELNLDTTACPNDVVITLAPESFEIILGNLISNAIKYCEPGAKIQVTLQATDTQLTLQCKDNGPGIAKADQAVIFERFSRLQQHAHIEGNGIGLSVVQQLVDMHGGNLSLDSDLGQGTCFTITLLRSNEAVSQTEMDTIINNMTIDLSNVESRQNLEHLDPMEPVAENQQDTTGVDKPELLIIEDNLDMQQYILSELNDHFNCLLARNGQLGVEMCLKVVPDIVISDVMMPVMDGYEVANRLRQDQRSSHIPIVLLTALNTTQSRIKGWQEHVDSYLTKPFDSEELLIKLHSILAIRKLLQTKNAQRFGDQVELDLPKIDNDFIMKLKEVIASHYTNPNLQRSHLASEMAISERQLLRKTKALINITPNDALREYRLEQAVQVLQTGKPVNLVSDACGFNSTSYFVRCFKAKYNITPKQYQKQITTGQ